MRIVKQRLLEMMPNLSIFLDVDDLEDISDLEGSVVVSRVVEGRLVGRVVSRVVGRVVGHWSLLATHHSLCALLTTRCVLLPCRYVDRSANILVFCSKGYFQSKNWCDLLSY